MAALPMTCHQGQRAQPLQVTTALFYGVSSIAIMMVNKIVLTSYGYSCHVPSAVMVADASILTRFPSAPFIALCQMIFTLVALYIARALGMVSFPSYSSKVFWQVRPAFNYCAICL